MGDVNGLKTGFAEIKGAWRYYEMAGGRKFVLTPGG
jgi:hypothetical protein